MADYEISAKITADTSGFDKGINSANKKTQSFSGSIKSLLKDISGGKGLSSALGGLVTKMGIAGVAIGATTQIIKKVSSAVSECTAEYRNFESGQRVLQQTLKVTGAEAWTNAQNLQAMQDRIQATTSYSSGEVQQLQTVLLGFKSIKGEVFEETTDAILDMATVMGMDLTNATQAVAKALDDPIKGLGSLSRQGFVFSEQQKEMIQGFIDAGETAKAQKVILDELNSTYGGASKSAVDSTKKMANAMADLKKEMGASFEENLSPMRTYFAELIQNWADAKKARREYENASSHENKTSDDNAVIIREKTKALEQQKTQYDRARQLVQMTNEELKKSAEYQDLVKNRANISVETYRKAQENLIHNYDYQKTELENLQNAEADRQRQAQKIAEETEKQNKLLAEQEALEKAIADRNNEIADLKKSSNEAVDEQERKWALTEKITGKVVSNEEKLEFYQNNLIDAMVEANGDITEANELYKKRIAIIDDLAKKVDAEDEAKINQQNYENAIKLETEKREEEKRIADEYFEETRKKAEEEAKEEEARNEARKEKFKSIMKSIGAVSLKVIGAYVKVMAQIVAKTISTVISALKTAFNAFKSLINLDLDDTLDKLLEFEDKVLTFFYSTLPKLPQFVATVLDSIGKLLDDVLAQLDDNGIKKIEGIVENIMTTITSKMPTLIDKLTKIVIKLLKSAIKSIESFFKSGGLSTIAKSLFSAIQELIKTLFSDLLGSSIIQDGIATLIIDAVNALPDIIDSIMTGIVNLLDTILILVKKLVESDGLSKIATSLLDGLEDILDWIIENADSLIKNLLQSVVNFILVVIKKLPTLLPKILTAILSLAGTIVKEVLIALPDVVIELLKQMPAIFNGLAKALWEGIGQAFENIVAGIGKFAVKLWKELKNLLGFATGTNNAPSGLALVGEKGPELVDLHGGERIYTAQKTQAILSGSGSSGNSFSVTFNNTQDTTAYAMLRQLKSYNRQMAINGVL